MIPSKFIERNFITPSSINEVKDLKESDNAFNSVKNLVENDKIAMIYDDNTFKSDELLHRGDFVLIFNSALEALKTMKTNASVDSSVVNTFDRNRSGAYLTTVAQVKDLKEGSIYYPASKSLIETWGIAEPFLINKTLSASSVMTEKEVYDVLHSTMGYTSAGINPYSAGITRAKFAILLNNAVLQTGERIAGYHTEVMTRREAERRAQQAIMDQNDKLRKDSISKVMEVQRINAANEAIANKSKGKSKIKNK